MLGEVRRRVKVVLLITMLIGLEFRHCQPHVRFTSDVRQSGASDADDVDLNNCKPACPLGSLLASVGCQEHATCAAQETLLYAHDRGEAHRPRSTLIDGFVDKLVLRALVEQPRPDYDERESAKLEYGDNLDTSASGKRPLKGSGLYGQYVPNFISLRGRPSLTSDRPVFVQDPVGFRRNRFARFRHLAWGFVMNSPAAPFWARALAEAYQIITVLMMLLVFVVDSGAVSRTEILVFQYMELTLIILYSMEYAARIFSCVETLKGQPIFHDRGSLTAYRLRFALAPMMVIDLLGIVALVLHFAIQARGMTTYTSLRVLRIINIFRMERNFHQGKRVLSVFWMKRVELASTFGIAVVLIVFASAAMYYVESPTNPAYSSILASMWWATTALTTVGYGDAVPNTPLGKVVGSLTAFVGVWFFALPTGLIASGLEQLAFERAKQKKEHPLSGKIEALQQDMELLFEGQKRLIAMMEQMCNRSESAKAVSFRRA